MTIRIFCCLRTSRSSHIDLAAPSHLEPQSFKRIPVTVVFQVVHHMSSLQFQRLPITAHQQVVKRNGLQHKGTHYVHRQDNSGLVCG